jgi:hypothetical protein
MQVAAAHAQPDDGSHLAVAKHDARGVPFDESTAPVKGASLHQHISAVLDADAILLACDAEGPVKRAGQDADADTVAKKKYRRSW